MQKKTNSSATKWPLALLLGIGLAALATPASIFADQATWSSAANGDWTNPLNWSTQPAFPNNGNAGVNYDVVINAVGTPYTVSLGMDITVNSLLLNSPNAQLIQTGSVFTAPAITLTAGTYRVNEGTIRSSAITGSTGAQLIFAGSGGLLDGTTVQNTNITISAGTVLNFNQTITGGTVTGVVGSNLTGSGTLDGVTLAGTNAIGTGAVVLNNAITNTGTLTFAGVNNGGETLYANGGVTLTGGGEVILVNNDSQINTVAGGSTLTNMNNHIHGGNGATIANVGLINQSVITADVGTLNILNNNVDNTGGRIEISSGAALNFNGTISNGTIAGQVGGTLMGGGTLDGVSLSGTNAVGTGSIAIGDTIHNSGKLTFAGAHAGSEALYANGTVSLTGGGEVILVNNDSQITTSAGGSTLTNVDNHIHGGNGATIANVGLINQSVITADSGVLNILNDNVDNTGGRIEVSNGAALNFNGTISNGTIAGQAGSVLTGGGALDGVTLTGTNAVGTGSIAIGDTIHNTGKLTFAGAHAGSEALYANGTVSLTGGGEVILVNNDSQITTSAGGSTLTNVDNHIHGGNGATIANVGLINQSVITADSGVLNILNDNVDNTGGRIEVSNGAALNFNGTISNGTIAGQAGSVLTGGGALDGVTLTGTNAVGTGSVTLYDIITNIGTITFAGAHGGSETLDANGDVTLTGGGEVLLVNSDSQINTSAGGSTLTNVNNHIHGGNGATIANVGLINQSVITADGGVLNILNDNVDNTGGQITILSGATLNFNQTISHGTLTGQAGSVLTGGGALDGVTLTGTNTIGTGSVTLYDIITNTGTITFAGVHGGSETLDANGDVTLTGGGEVLLVNSDSQINTSASGSTLTNVNNHIHGGNGATIANVGLINQSVITADSGVLNILNDSVDNTGGRIEVSNGAALNFNGTISNGTIAGQAGSVLTGGGALDGVTLTGTNAVGTGSVTLYDIITNIGTITFAGAHGGSETLDANGDVALTGGGEVLLVNSDSQINTSAGGSTLTNVNNHIHGGNGATIANVGLINQSVITADGGVLNILNNNVNNTGGRIEVSSGAALNFNQTISNGTVAGQAGSILTGGGTLDGVTLTGTNAVGTGSIAIGDTIHNTGKLTFAGALAGSEALYANGTVSLTGGGEVLLVNNDSQITTSAGGSTLTNVDNFIHGGNGATIAVPLINQGTLRAESGIFTITGDLPNSGSVSVAAGATLAIGGTMTQTAGRTSVDGLLSVSGGLNVLGGIVDGAGTVSGPVANGGVVAPGSGVGKLTLENGYTQNAGGLLQIEIAGTAPDQFDLLAVDGSVTLQLGSAVEFDFIGGFAPKAGDKFDFLSFGDPTLTGGFDNIDIEGLAPGFQYTVAPDGPGLYALTAVNDGISVPEPSSMLLALIGGIAFLARRRR